MLVIGPSSRLPNFCLHSVFLATSCVSFFFFTTNNFEFAFLLSSRKSFLLEYINCTSYSTWKCNKQGSLRRLLLLCMDRQASGKYSVILLAFSKKMSFHLEKKKNKTWDNRLPAEILHMEICDSQIFWPVMWHLFIACRGSPGVYKFYIQMIFFMFLNSVFFLYHIFK